VATRDLVKRHERSLHAEAYKAAHPSEFGSASCPGGSKAPNLDLDKHHSETGADFEPDVNSSGRQLDELLGQMPPLTPETETMQLDSDMNSECYLSKKDIALPNLTLSPAYVENQQLLPHQMSLTLTQYSPPESLIEQSIIQQSESNASEPFTSCESFHSAGQVLRAGSPNHAVSQESVSGYEPASPDNHKRVEIDPQLLDNAFGTQQFNPSSLIQEFHDPFELPYEGLDYLDFSLAQSALAADNGLPAQVTAGDIFGDKRLNTVPSLDLEDVNPLNSPEKSEADVDFVPQVLKEETIHLKKFEFNESIRGRICNDACNRMPPGELSQALFPSANELERFCAAYIDCFHPHFPILHLPSFNLLETPSPLIFAVCSIGALYQLERSKSKNLFALAGTMSSYVSVRDHP
jgi:hypothetical protein